MIDNFLVIHKGGVVLFKKELFPLRGPVVRTLISKVLLEERSGSGATTLDEYALRWTFENELDLVFLAVYQKVVILPYIEDLLAMVKESFCKWTGDDNEETFETVYDRIVAECEKRQEKDKVTKKQPASYEEKHETTQEEKEDRIAQKREEMLKKVADRKSPTQMKTYADKKKAASSPSPDGKTTKSKGKEARTWDDKPKDGDLEVLDYSKSSGAGDGAGAAPIISKELQESVGASRMEGMESSDEEDNDIAEVDGDDDDDGDQNDQNQKRKKASTFGLSRFTWGKNLMDRLKGSREVEEADLAPALDKFEEHLIGKNVAREVAHQICESIRASLLGKKLSTFGTVDALTRKALREAVMRLLTPERKIDVLRDIAALQKQRPYVISFVGVNGVGKSTSLSKVCKWLQLNGLSVMIAACDTFRAGAIEQLKVHSQRLNVPVYSSQYGKDPADVARLAILKAKQEKMDVVLVDTAGRMQDNEPLMRALGKLIEVNNPDLVLFVGEALVGNDGVDQLQNFHKALLREGTRGVDGVFLTKFDTVDDQVGAALSMVYATGRPIVFVGCGQTYTDLKKLHVSEVVNSLLKP